MSLSDASSSDKKKSVRVSAATILTTNGLAVTTGYLLKLSTPSSKSGNALPGVWKKRYFMLRGCTLTYYADHTSMDSPKGELLVFGETRFEIDEFAQQKHCFTLAVPFALLNLSCENGVDFIVWTKAFKKSISLAQQALTSYIDKVSDAEEVSKRKFFILHQDAITFHKDEYTTSSVQGLLHLNDNTSMEYYDKKRQINVIDTNEKHSLMLSFQERKLHVKDADYLEWKEALIANLQLYAANIQDAETSFNTAIGLPAMIKKGTLFMRPPKGGDEIWPEHQFYLNDTQMVAVSTSRVGGKEHLKMMGDFEITPNCSVFETNLGPHTFELVTASKVLHVRASTSYEVSSWIEAIRDAISKSYLDTKDELFQQSILRIDNDEFYTVHFTEKKPLGVVFERSGEWAIIKSSANQAESGMLVGSVLSAVDKKSVILEGYQDVIDRLKGWQPPLALTFRRAPRKNGFLLKESKSRSNPQKMVWKKRYFVLGEGKILYRDTADVGGRIKGECPLMGSVVSLIKEGEAGKRNCFRVMSGMMYLTLQCSNEHQMMEWASTMYHAISIANGGAYILQYEIDRLTAHAEDSKAAELLLRGVRIPSVRIKSNSKSPPNHIRRTLSSTETNTNTSTTITTITTLHTTEYEENYEKLELAMRNSTYDNFGELVKMICQTKVHGINVDRAEARLAELKAIKKRRSVDPKTYRMDGEGEDEVQAQLYSIRERNERQKVADASAQLVHVVQTVGYDMESVQGLERAIAQAIKAGVSRENVDKAKQLLASLHEGKHLLDEALRTLQTAMRKRSLPMLIDAVNTASEIGFHHEQLAADVSNARRIIIEIKTEQFEESLERCMSEASVDNYDSLAIAVERARGSNVNPSKVARAQAVLSDLRRKNSEQDDVIHTIRKAINLRDMELLQSALHTASLRGVTGQEVDTATNIVWDMERAHADSQMQMAADRATVDDYSRLEELVGIETSGTAFSTSPRSSSTSSSDSRNPGDRVGCGHSVALMGYSKLQLLKAARKDQTHILHILAVAMKHKNIPDIDRAVSGADEIDFRHANVEEGRAMLRRLLNEERGKLGRDEEIARALKAIKDEMARESPLAVALKRALDSAFACGINDGPVIVAGQQMLLKLNAQNAEIALNRALDAATFDRDCRALEEAIARAQNDMVNSIRISQAQMMLSELLDDKANRNKALQLLEQAVLRRDIVLIQQSLDVLSDMAGGGIAPGPEADRARKVMAEVRREDATAALKLALSSPTVMTAAGFDEEKFMRLWRAVENADRYLPLDSEILMKGRGRLEEQKVLKTKCNSAAATVARAMDAQDIPALELALQDSHLLSADCLLASCTMFSNLKQTNAAAILSAAVMSSDKSSVTLAAAIEQAKRDGVKAIKINEAEIRLAKLRRDEQLREEIDAALSPAIDTKSLESLELQLQKATAHSITSHTIETARQLVGQLRTQGDRKRILLLLSDSLRLRSVSVLEHVIKSADDADIDCELLNRAKEYHATLLSRDQELLKQEGKPKSLLAGLLEKDASAVPDKDKLSSIEKMALQYLQTNETTGEYSDDEDDMDDGIEELSQTQPEPIAPVRKRSVLFKEEHVSVEEDMKGLFSSYCSMIDSTGANCPEFINAMKFSSIWRMITGEKGNLFKEMQMYKKFDVANRGALSEMDFLDGWANVFQEPGGDVYLKRFRVLAAEGFAKDKKAYA